MVNFASSVTRTVIGAIGTALCAGTCLLAAAGPAGAEPIRQATVRYADLDLHSARGRAVLDRRVASAARDVCSSADTSLAGRLEERRCVRHALATARPVVG